MAIGRVLAMIAVDAGSPSFVVRLNRGASSITRISVGLYEIVLSQGVAENESASTLTLRQGDPSTDGIKFWLEQPVDPTVKRVHTLLGAVPVDLDFDLMVFSVT